ncbi:MAG: PIG-L family deacetylase [Kiritimatiellae bacterium]|nr:PIG-L family deacetylase [Kiritimatiellia bacterium]
MKKCIVVFAAHTADAELGAGGTIAKFVRKGYRALVVVVTTGVGEPVVELVPNERESDTRGPGSPATRMEGRAPSRPRPARRPALQQTHEAANPLNGRPLTPCELAALREQEAAAAAGVMGYELEFLRFNERFFTHEGKRYAVDFRDGPPPADLPGTGWFGSVSPDASVFAKTAEETLLREEPEFILTHSVADACYERHLVAEVLAPVYRRLLERDRPPIGKLLAWEADQRTRTFEIPVGGIEDITESRAIKYQALSKHASRVDQAAFDAAEARDTHWGRILNRLVSTDPRQAYGEAFSRQCMRVGLAQA